MSYLILPGTFRIVRGDGTVPSDHPRGSAPTKVGQLTAPQGQQAQPGSPTSVPRRL